MSVVATEKQVIDRWNMRESMGISYWAMELKIEMQTGSRAILGGVVRPIWAVSRVKYYHRGGHWKEGDGQKYTSSRGREETGVSELSKYILMCHTYWLEGLSMARIRLTQQERTQ